MLLPVIVSVISLRWEKKISGPTGPLLSWTIEKSPEESERGLSTSRAVSQQPLGLILFPLCREGRARSHFWGLGRGPGPDNQTQGAVQKGAQGEKGGEE